MELRKTKDWWKQAVIYQIYTKSFQDSDGDGIGDLRGIITRLDYLEKLGVDILWISPIYQSPNADNGYDISNYYEIMETFGDMGDFDELLEKAHNRDIKIVLDMVVNHTSDEHSWFLTAKESRTNEYRDFYIWKDRTKDCPPNNWIGMFGGSTWKYDDTTEQYYLHLFSEKQPDLNWENKKVRESVYDIMNWWVEKGIDGFRMDVINFISKDMTFPNGVDGNGKPFFENGPRIHEFLQEMNQNVVNNNEILMIGEMPDVTTKEAQLYTDNERKELDMVFSFEHVELGYGKYGKWSVDEWKLTDLKKVVKRWQTDLSDIGWNSLYWSNHDQPRAVSRFGNDTEKYRVLSAKMLAICLHMQKGTPFIYQGEEIGMTNTWFDTIEEYQDIEILNGYNDYCESGLITEDEFLEAAYAHGRESARVPMAWDDSINGGFSTGIPWIRPHKEYKKINAKMNLEDPNSIYNFYKKLIELRHKNSIMVYGNFKMILDVDENIFAYSRQYKDEKWVVMCNFTEHIVDVELPIEFQNTTIKDVIISNYENVSITLPQLKLRAFESVVLSVVSV